MEERKRQELESKKNKELHTEQKEKSLMHEKKIPELKNKIVQKEAELKVAAAVTKEGNENLSQLLNNKCKSLNKNGIMEAHSMIGMGLEKAEKVKRELEELKKLMQQQERDGKRFKKK